MVPDHIKIFPLNANRIDSRKKTEVPANHGTLGLVIQGG